MLAVLAALLALPAVSAAAGHRGGTFVTLATSNGGTADPQVNATQQYWQLFQVTQDGLTAFRKSSGPSANSVVADLAVKLPRTTDGGRTWTLTLRRGVRYSNGERVRPGDVRFTFERLFKVHGPTAESLYGVIDGSAACLQDPATCTLESGISVSGRTITFHLTRPDTEWLQKLALPPAALLPPSVGSEEIGTRGLAAGGHGPLRLGLVLAGPAARAQAEPLLQGLGAGGPARRLRRCDRAALRPERRGRGHAGRAGTGRLDRRRRAAPTACRSCSAGSRRRRTSTRCRPTGTSRSTSTSSRSTRSRRDRPSTWRSTARRSSGSSAAPRLATPTCQVLPPAFPGYAPYCPWTLGGEAPWSAPDLARAAQLVEESGTKGDRVDIVVADDRVQKAIGQYIFGVLFKLGFDPRLMPLPDGVQAAFVQNSRNHVEMGLSQWHQQYPAPSEVLDGLLGCGSFVPDSDASPNISGFCDRKTVQPLMQRAVALGLTRPQAAERLWRQVDRHVVDLAVWLPLFNPKQTDLVSPRVGNYRWSPQLHLMPSLLWVK